MNIQSCPFCGDSQIELADSSVPNIRGGKKTAMFCAECFCEGPLKDHESAAIEAWNTRADCWRPIEEAPKDGTEVLLHEPGVVTVGFWSNNRKRWIDATDDEHDRAYRFEPTHFMPLPNPPKK